MQKNKTKELKDTIQKRLDIHNCTGRCTDYIVKLFSQERKQWEDELEAQYQIGYDEGHKAGWEERGKL